MVNTSCDYLLLDRGTHAELMAPDGTILRAKWPELAAVAETLVRLGYTVSDWHVPSQVVDSKR